MGKAAGVCGEATGRLGCNNHGSWLRPRNYIPYNSARLRRRQRRQRRQRWWWHSLFSHTTQHNNKHSCSSSYSTRSFGLFHTYSLFHFFSFLFSFFFFSQRAVCETEGEVTAVYNSLQQSIYACIVFLRTRITLKQMWQVPFLNFF